MQHLLDEVKQLSVSELEALNRFVVATVKAKRQLEGFKVVAKLKEGMTVKIDHASHRNSKFIIKKLNRTKAVVTKEGDDFTQYTVAFNMIITE